MLTGTRSATDNKSNPADYEDFDDEDSLWFYRVGDYCFSSDFRAVSYKGKSLFEFTPTQAKILAILHSELDHGFPSVLQEKVFARLNDQRDMPYSDNTRLRDFFHHRKVPHPAWEKFLKVTDGAYSRIRFDFSWRPLQ